MKLTIRLLAKIALLPLGMSISSTAYTQTDIMNATLEKLSAGIKKIESACGEDIKKYCSAVTPGSGRLLYCIQAHEDKITDGCGSVLDEVVLQTELSADNLREAGNACRSDINKFCANIQPGQGRITTCLTANKTAVSASCGEAVQKLQAQ
jgi:hypothetical protein